MQQGRWRILIIATVLLAAAVVGRTPSRMVMALLVLGTGAFFVLGQDVRNLLLAFPGVALLVPLQFGTGTDVSLNAAVFAAIGLVGYGIVQKSLQRDWRMVHSRLHRPLIAFVLVSILSLLVGNAFWDVAVPRPSNFILVQMGQLAIYFLCFAMFWFTAFFVPNATWLRRLAYALIITGGVGTLGFGLSRLLGFHLPIVAIISNMFTVWLIPLAFSQAVHDSELTLRECRLLFGLVCLAVTVVVWAWFVDTNWVGGWFPAMVSLGLLLWLRYPSLRWIIGLVAVIIIIVVGVGPFFQVLDFDVETKWDISGGSRMTLWRSVLELSTPRPVLGLGIAAYRHYHFLKPLTYGRTLWMRPTVSAHNMFIDLFAQMGIVGVICYLWFLAEALLLAWRVYRRSTGFARGYALTAFCALVGIIAADMLAETSLPFVYNVGFPGFRASAVSWMMLGGLVVLENQHEPAIDQ